MSDTPEPAPTRPETIEAPLWARAAPWFAAYGALLLILGLIRLPDRLPPLFVALASLLVSLAVIFLASAALYAVVRQRLAPRDLALLFGVGVLCFFFDAVLFRLWGALHGPRPPRA